MVSWRSTEDTHQKISTLVIFMVLVLAKIPGIQFPDYTRNGGLADVPRLGQMVWS